LEAILGTVVGRLLALVAMLLVVAAPAAATLSAPRLQALVREPLRIRGTHFRAGERATVTLLAPVWRVRHVTVGPQGAFVTGFGNVLDDPCSGFFVRAVGATGDHAAMRGLPLTQCPPP
jgi:hypothetical protein